jgi:hypothetical protein
MGTMLSTLWKSTWRQTERPRRDNNTHESMSIETVLDSEKAGAPDSIQTALTTPVSSPAASVHLVNSDYPEGGLSGWLVVFGSFCAMLSVFGLINTAAVFESWFSTHQLKQYSPSQIGWVFSLYLFFVFFIGIQVGPAFDAYGPRCLVAVGSFLMAASLFLLGFCTGKTIPASH